MRVTRRGLFGLVVGALGGKAVPRLQAPPRKIGRLAVQLTVDTRPIVAAISSCQQSIDAAIARELARFIAARCDREMLE